MFQKRHSTGFILPTVLAISLAAIVIMVSLFALTTATFKDSSTEYYQKLSEEAAEAGSAYATACLNLSGHVQTWGPAASKGNLRTTTDCNGDNNFSSNTYVFSNSQVRSYFVVANLDYSYPFSAQISSQGYVEVLRGDGSIGSTYTSIRKKSITWPTDIEGQKSASGTNRTCAIVNYRVYCWGYNAYGQLGDGRYIGGSADIETASAVDSTVPVKVRQDAGVMAGKKIIDLFVAQYHSCALSDDGLVFCWGYNSSGQLGNNTTTDSPVPVQVGGALAGKVVTSIGGTHNVSCAIATGKIYCWGTSENGVIGRSTASNTLTPTLVTAGNTTSTLATNYTASKLSTNGSRSKTMCAIVSGKAYCWGLNTVGSVGDGTTGNNRNLPTKVIDTGALLNRTVTAIAQDGYSTASSGGYAHVCAVASGAVFCWGDNDKGQLGDGTSGASADKSSPVAVSTTLGSGVLNGKTVQDVQVGLRHSCVKANNGAYCWGYNASGMLGDNTSGDKAYAVAVAQQAGNLTASNVTAIGAGANRGCAVVTDGRTFCWGLNSTGQIGDGTKYNNRYVPTESLFLRPSGNQYIF